MKIILAILFIFAVMLSGCTGPSLTVEEVSGNDQFGLSQGCYSTVSGQVKNNGGATAQEITVTCSTTQQGNIIATNNINVGSINTDSQIPFSIDVDTDCLKGNVTYSCVANCSNC